MANFTSLVISHRGAKAEDLRSAAQELAIAAAAVNNPSVAAMIIDRRDQVLAWAFQVEAGDVYGDRIAEINEGTTEFLRMVR
jgi:hypothetical protein